MGNFVKKSGRGRDTRPRELVVEDALERAGLTVRVVDLAKPFAIRGLKLNPSELRISTGAYSKDLPKTFTATPTLPSSVRVPSNEPGLIASAIEMFSVNPLISILPIAALGVIAYFALSGDVPDLADFSLLNGALVGFAKKNKGAQDNNKQPPKEDDGSTPRYITAQGTMARLTRSGLEVNSKLKLFIIDVVFQKSSLNDPSIKGDATVKRIKAMFSEIESYAEYSDLLKFIVLLGAPDRAAFLAISNLVNWTRSSLIGTVRHHFLRMFPVHPKLPVEHGMWTELVDRYNAFKTDEKNFDKFEQLLIFYCNCFPEKLVYKEGSVAFGPLSFTNADLARFLYLKNASYLNKMKSPALSSKEKRLKIRDLETERNAKAFLERGDLPASLREMLGVVYYLGGEDGLKSACDLFEDNVFSKSNPEAMSIRLKELFEKYVSPRINSAGKKKPSAPVVPEVKATAVQLPNKLNVLHGITKYIGRDLFCSQNPDRSYTTFLRPDSVAMYMQMIVRKLVKMSQYETSDSKMLLSNVYLVLDFVREYQPAPGVGSDVVSSVKLAKSAVLDLLMQKAFMNDEILAEVCRIISTNLTNPKNLAQLAIEYYKKQIPYGAELLQRIKNEEAASLDPLAVAGKHLRGGLPESVLRNAPPNDRAMLQSKLVQALVDVGNDPAVYKKWFKKMSELSARSSDWQWLEGAASDPSSFTDRLQALVFPVMGEEVAERPLFNLQSYGIDITAWNKFVKESSYLLPEDWASFVETLTFLREEAGDAVGSLLFRMEKKDIPQAALQKKALFKGDNLSEALNSLANVLNGGLGEENAYFARRLLKMSLGSADMLCSLLMFARRVAKGDRNTQTLLALEYMKEMLATGNVSGDVIDLSARLAFSGGDNAVLQGAIAEYKTVMEFAKYGSKVRIISPDRYMESQSPDIKVETGGVLSFVEVKSRRFYSEIDDFDEVVRPAITEAAEQITSRQRKVFGNNKGVVVLYLLGSSAENKVVEMIKGLLKSHTLSRLFQNIDRVEVYFVSTSNPASGNWPIRSHHIVRVD